MAKISKIQARLNAKHVKAAPVKKSGIAVFDIKNDITFAAEVDLTTCLNQQLKQSFEIIKAENGLDASQLFDFMINGFKFIPGVNDQVTFVSAVAGLIAYVLPVTQAGGFWGIYRHDDQIDFVNFPDEAAFMEFAEKLKPTEHTRSTHASPVEHQVKEHLRHYKSGKVVTVKSHTRGKN